MNNQAGALYAEREKRFNDIVALKKPDRIPVNALVTHYFPTKVKGVSNRDAGYDHALRYRCMKSAVRPANSSGGRNAVQHQSPRHGGPHGLRVH